MFSVLFDCTYPAAKNVENVQPRFSMNELNTWRLSYGFKCLNGSIPSVYNGCETVFVHTLASSSLGFLRLKTDSGMAGAGHGWFQVEKASRKKLWVGRFSCITIRSPPQSGSHKTSWWFFSQAESDLFFSTVVKLDHFPNFRDENSKNI